MSKPRSRTDGQMREAIRDMLETYSLPDTSFVIELADAWLADHPEDDDEPITQEWAKDCWPIPAEALGLELDDIGAGDYAIYSRCEDCDDSRWLRSVATRGDVRAFLRGMGLDTKGGE